MLLLQDIAIEVIRVFMRYVPDAKASLMVQMGNVKRSVPRLARLDNFISTILFCVSENGRNTTGGHR